MSFQAKKWVTAQTPQIVTLLGQDSNTFRGGLSKQLTECVQDLVITIQAKSLGAKRPRYLLSIAKFGTAVSPMFVAASPCEVDLNKLTFSGVSGEADLAAALRWATNTIERALDRCRQNHDYLEERAPNPVCIVFSDGKNTGRDLEAAAIALRSVPFKGGTVDVVVCSFSSGRWRRSFLAVVRILSTLTQRLMQIGLEPKDFTVIQMIASRPDFALSIIPDAMSEFLAPCYGSEPPHTTPDELRWP